jgi:uncharacterized protein
VIFVDTGAWFAAFVAKDGDHQVALNWLKTNTEPLVTTDYVIDELLSLLRFRGQNDIALRVGPRLFDQSLSRVAWVGPEDVREAWQIYKSFADKAWSFTDCVSRAVMTKLNIRTAFAFDADFRQFGTVNVVP